MSTPGYQGNDRRKHVVYRTRNTEYHLRDGVCIAVRDRHTRVWRTAHIALNLRLEGGVRIYSNGAAVPSMTKPQMGDAIYFTDRQGETERQIVTSRLEAVDRPSREEVQSYPLVCGF